MKIAFTVYGKPEPQGSKTPWLPRYKGGAFVTGRNGQPVIATMDSNKRLKPWRQEVVRTALDAVRDPKVQLDGVVPFPKGVAVHLVLRFFLEKPASVPKRRLYPVVKPDASKLLRAVEDSLTGTVWHDDAQVVSTHVEKHYGTPQRVEIEVCSIEEKAA